MGNASWSRMWHSRPRLCHSQMKLERKYEYRRNLPHYQKDFCRLYVTFSTYGRWELPPRARDLALKHCRYEHGRRIELHCAVVMPDHVHLIFTALRNSDGVMFTLAEIMRGIKGSSAHSINRALNRGGHVWQDESFDHVLRSWESLGAKIRYVCANPVRAGLVKKPEDYPWLWYDEATLRID